jgi:4-hydroxy-3-methylbut-2-enyl diphosphate reductase
MEVTLAKTAGFCFGVHRAVNMCYDEADTSNKVFTLGPIIHNENVVEDLEKKGVYVIDSARDLKNLLDLYDLKNTDPAEVKALEDKYSSQVRAIAGMSPEDVTVIIRSHGIPKDEYDLLKDSKVKIVDATCPFVGKIHRIVSEKHNAGSQIVIVGSKKHPEVMGINGWCDNTAIVVETAEDAQNIELGCDKPVTVVSQTTFNYKKFQDIVDILKKLRYDITVVNTICNATEERQTEAALLAQQSEAMIVIGGHNSSNSQKLYEICKARCKNTYFIQTVKDLELVQLQSFRSVGITAGASTPNNIIKEVHSYVRGEQ